MTCKTAFALAAAACLLLASLPAPLVQAEPWEACPPTSDYVEAALWQVVAGTDGLWPPVQGWNPRPPWSGMGHSASLQAKAGYDGGCAWLDVEGDVGGIPVDPPQQDRAAQDLDGDGMGDSWTRDWEILANQVIRPLVDLDGDGLLNVREFQWELVPVCIPNVHQNCADHEADPAGGWGGDAWLDGAEVAYWNDPGNDNANPSSQGYALYDEDRLLDSDGDGWRNVQDLDSDNDGLLDGLEAAYDVYPEFADSDCRSLPCTPSSSTTRTGSRSGAPGSGDAIWDLAELDAWGPAWADDFDGDGYPNNLLDPDADNDGLFDGWEFLQSGNQASPSDADSDDDGLLDGQETAWNADSDGDGWRNVADGDSDNDAMPDLWERQNGLNMANGADAAQDRDNDGLVNLGEYQHATNPNDMDSENDLVLDGAEVNTHGTNPLFWDSDADGLPDHFEVLHSLDPLNALDAGLDVDGDSFDQDWDGQPELVWSNLQEYRYRRPAGHNEATQGPWLQGTSPRDWDTDDDEAPDGFEAHYGTDATFPVDGDPDTDEDGLNFTQEVRRGTSPMDADTDDDGLCDGGRGQACALFGGHPGGPGEQDYGSTPWMTDSDADGIGDWWEAVAMWDPGNTGSASDVDGDLLNGVIDADSDNDRLLDGDEANVRLTDPGLADTDADGLQDGAEALDHNTDPKDADHDNDGLQDGAEVDLHRTRPKDGDTDDDGLGDGAEVRTHGTDPLLRDTDGDGMPDGWEVQVGLQPRIQDADLDQDADGLNNLREFLIGTHPNDSDSENDGMPDGWEDRYTLAVTAPSAAGDADADGLVNLDEFNKKTHPRNADSDADGLGDGPEVNTHGTDPLLQDTDGDGLTEGPELAAWVAGSYSITDADGDTLSALRDPDSDNDGLTDREELIDTKTNPRVVDTDGDSLSDFDEVVTHGGRFNPRDADTDDDGQNDGIEASLLDPEGDTDKDGLKNGDESGTYTTDPTNPDSDCDGAQDGPERLYWDADWNNGVNRLLSSDVDGDGIKDGVELGTVGTPAQALYRTHPGLVDSDADGLNDDQEAQNNVKVSCGGPQGAGSQQQSSAGSGFIGPQLPPPEPIVAPSGLVLAKDHAGWFVRGGYGVHLYILNVSVEDFLLQPSAGGAPGVGKGGIGTDPSLPDTDADGLTDGQEATGSQNPYKDQKSNANLPGGNTDPVHADSDKDGIGDGLELGVGVVGVPWVTNPNRLDTDGDGANDNVEDSNQNGASDLGYDSLTGRYAQGTAGAVETSPVDADTDDDGIADLTERAPGSRTRPLEWDSDGDGLSDGLERAVTGHVIVNGIDYTTPRPVLDLAGWTTFQPFEGTVSAGIPLVTQPDVADSDSDGLLDGLEDWNHNGKRGDSALFGSTTAAELDPGSTDSDGDLLSDARELMMFIRKGEGGKPTVRFDQLVTAQNGGHAFSAAQLVHDAANRWETDPRVADTDLDGIKDGLDMNPRAGTNFLALAIDGLEFLDDGIDDWGGEEHAELYVSPMVIDLKFLGAKYDLQMPNPETTHVPMQFFQRYCMYWWSCTLLRMPFSGLPSALIDEMTDTSNLVDSPSSTALGVGAGAFWRLSRLGSEPIVKVQLPESIEQVNPNDLSVSVSIQFKDYDCCDADDPLDTNRDASKTAGEVSFNLATNDVAGKFTSEFGVDYLSEPTTMPEMRGTEVNGYHTDDARVRVKLMDTVPSHFVEAFKLTKVGTVASLDLHGKDYFGEMGELGSQP